MLTIFRFNQLFKLRCTKFILFTVLFFVICIDYNAAFTNFVDYYETLDYRPVLSKKKRSIEDNNSDNSINLRFKSHNKTFHLNLLPIGQNKNIFAEDFFLDVDNKIISETPEIDKFLYEGYVKDDLTSKVYGSIIDGIFDGTIILSNGDSYTVEKAAKYVDVKQKPIKFHSFIYNNVQVNHSPFKRFKRDLNNKTSDTNCGLTSEIYEEMKKIQKSAVLSENEKYTGKPISKLQSYLHKDHINDIFYDSKKLNRQKRGLFNKYSINEINGKKLYTVRTCTMYLQADQELYNLIYEKEGNNDHMRTRNEIIGLFYTHIRAVNQIYESTIFGGIKGLNFVIQRLSIYTKENCLNGKPVPGSDNPFCQENVDVSNYLNLNSQRNHSAFCLAYALTFRDFIGGTLGLAWVASPIYNTAGGICQLYQKYNGDQHGTTYRSLNTGVVTLLNYGNRVPLRVSQLTMAHEIGHNFGAPHDESAECQPGLPDGNYIMFASATSGDKINNGKFSKCSVENISQVLYEVLQQPPVDAHHLMMPMYERTSAFCGNQIREPKEECDCGFLQQDCDEMGDRCCSPRESSQPCKRTFNSKCSPSEGVCCKASTCSFYSASENKMCRKESECLFRQVCDGKGAACPESRKKRDGMTCQDETKVCQSGSCNGSICAHVGLKDCFLTVGSPSRLCHLACEKNGTCYSSFDLPEFAAGKFNQTNRKNLPGLLLHPGSPCNNYKGYCDILPKCRSVDSNGPLAQLKNLVFNKHTIKTVFQWIQEHWWACVLIGILMLLFMALFVKCCAVHTPSTNPNKIPAQHFSDTLRHPGTLLRRGRHVQHCAPCSINLPNPRNVSSAELNHVITVPNNVRIGPTTSGGARGGHYRNHHPRPNKHKNRRQHNFQHNKNFERRSAHTQNQSTSANRPSASHHRSHVSGNRVPLNLTAPPLIPPLNQMDTVMLMGSTLQNFVSLPEPPPPYTPTDPATQLSMPSSNLAGTTTTTTLLDPITENLNLAENIIASNNAQDNAKVVSVNQNTPTTTTLSLSTGTVPLVIGPPLPGQGPKPGRRRTKQSTPLQPNYKKQRNNSLLVNKRSTVFSKPSKKSAM